MANAAITVDLNARIAQFETELKKATGTLDNFGKKGDQIAAGFKTAFGALGAAVSVGAFAGFIKSSIDAQDAISKLSQKTGIAVEALAGLQHAANLSDVGVDQLAKGVRTFSVVVSESARGMKSYQDKLTALGLDYKKLKDLSPEDQFYALADAVQKLGKEDRAVAVSSALGDKMSVLVPLLSGGADGLRQMVEEGQKYNPVTAESARLAEEFNDNLTRLQASASAAGVSIASDLLPSLSATAQRVRELMDEDKGIQALIRAFAGLGKLPWDLLFGDIKAASTANDRIKELKDELNGLQRDLKSAESGGGKSSVVMRKIFGTPEEINQQITVIKNQIVALEKFGDQIYKPKGGSVVPVIDPAQIACSAKGGTWDGKKCVIKPTGGAKSDPLASLLGSTDIGKMEEFEKKVALLNARFDGGRKSSELYTQAMTKLIEAAFSGNFSQAMTERIANEKKLSDEIDRTIDGLDERALAESDSFESLEDLISGIELETEMIGMSNEAREEAIALRTLEAEGINLSADALDEYRERLSAAMNSKQAASAAKESADTAAAEWKRASDDIERSLTDALMRGFEGGKGWASNFADTLKNMFSTLVLRPLLQPIAQGGASMTMGALGMGSSGASAGGLLSSGSSLLSTGGAAAGYMGSLGTMASYTGAALSGGAIAGATQGGMLAAQTGAFGAAGAASTASALGGASAGLAAVPVVGWVALAALAIFALSGKKPSDKSGWSEVDLASGESLGTGGLEGKKFSQENRDAAKATTDVGAAWAQLLTDLGAEISGALKIEIGDRDGFKADLDGDGAWDILEKDQEVFFDRLFDALTNSATGLDSVLKDMLVSFDGTTEQMLEFAGALVAIRDYTSADLMTDALDQIEQAGRSTWQTWESGNTELREMAANFDGSLASATDLATASANMYQLELSLIGQIQGLLISTNAMFGNSIEQIKLSNMDAAQQYDYWRAEVDKDYADLLAATDPAEIARLSGEINQGSMNAYGLLEDDQKAALAPEFIEYLEGADTLTTERLNASQDAIVATHKDLTTAIETVMTQVAEKMMAAAEISLAAAQIPVTVLVRGDDGYRDSMTPIGEVG